MTSPLSSTHSSQDSLSRHQGVAQSQHQQQLTQHQHLLQLQQLQQQQLMHQQQQHLQQNQPAAMMMMKKKPGSIKTSLGRIFSKKDKQRKDMLIPHQGGAGARGGGGGGGVNRGGPGEFVDSRNQPDYSS